MAICQMMIADFMRGVGREGYDAYDLAVGVDYCEALLAEGHTKEPFHHYDLEAFIAWARKKLSSRKTT